MSRLSDGTIEWHSPACVDYVWAWLKYWTIGRVDCENLWAFFVCVVVGDSFQILSRVPDQYLKIRANLALVLG